MLKKSIESGFILPVIIIFATALNFNSFLKRVGHLFQDRFKSEIVYDDDNLLAACDIYITIRQKQS